MPAKAGIHEAQSRKVDMKSIKSVEVDPEGPENWPHKYNYDLSYSRTV